VPAADATATTPVAQAPRETPAPRDIAVPPAPVPAPIGLAGDVSGEIAAEPTLRSAEYAATVEELTALAAEARPRWSDDHAAAFDARVATLRRAIASASSERARHTAYRALIRYLQGAAVRDEVALAGIGGRP
jgi:hypothetical protein